jgi:hypothetical protein
MPDDFMGKYCIKIEQGIIQNTSIIFSCLKIYIYAISVLGEYSERLKSMKYWPILVDFWQNATNFIFFIF